MSATYIHDTYMHTHKFTYMHKHMFTYIHTHTQTNTYVHAYIRTDIRTKAKANYEHITLNEMLLLPFVHDSLILLQTHEKPAESSDSTYLLLIDQAKMHFSFLLQIDILLSFPLLMKSPATFFCSLLLNPTLSTLFRMNSTDLLNEPSHFMQQK